MLRLSLVELLLGWTVNIPHLGVIVDWLPKTLGKVLWQRCCYAFANALLPVGLRECWLPRLPWGWLRPWGWVLAIWVEVMKATVLPLTLWVSFFCHSCPRSYQMAYVHNVVGLLNVDQASHKWEMNVCVDCFWPVGVFVARAEPIFSFLIQLCDCLVGAIGSDHGTWRWRCSFF